MKRDAAVATVALPRRVPDTLDFPGAVPGIRKRRPFRLVRFALEPCDATSGWHRIGLAVTLHGTSESALPVWEAEGFIDLRTGDV